MSNVHPIAFFDAFLTSKLTQLDMSLECRGEFNPYRLANWFLAQPPALPKQSLEEYRDSIRAAFLPGFSPADSTVKAIDKYMTTKKLPRFPVSKEVRDLGAKMKEYTLAQAKDEEPLRENHDIPTYGNGRLR